MRSHVTKVVGVVLVAAALALAVMTHGIVIVAGGSMEPALSQGDICVYRRARMVRPTSVVVFERTGGRGLVVHRVVWAGPQGDVRTQGDANGVRDPEVVPAADVRGQVVLTIPLGGFVRR